LAARDPGNTRAQRLLFDQLRKLAAVLRETKPAESGQLYERSVTGSEALWKKIPEDRASARALANHCRRRIYWIACPLRAPSKTASGKYDAACQSLAEAIGIASSLSKLGRIGIYEERCLALTEAAMGDLERTLANQCGATRIWLFRIPHMTSSRCCRNWLPWRNRAQRRLVESTGVVRRRHAD